MKKNRKRDKKATVYVRNTLRRGLVLEWVEKRELSEVNCEVSLPGDGLYRVTVPLYKLIFAFWGAAGSDVHVFRKAGARWTPGALQCRRARKVVKQRAGRD